MGDESLDEDHVLSVDSHRNCTDDFTEISEKIVTNSQINALNGGTKRSALYIFTIPRMVLWLCARHE